ncbi:hypothetical protein [Pendulispora albinea]
MATTQRLLAEIHYELRPLTIAIAAATMRAPCSSDFGAGDRRTL